MEESLIIRFIHALKNWNTDYTDRTDFHRWDFEQRRYFKQRCGYSGQSFSININAPPELSSRKIGTRSTEHRNTQSETCNLKFEIWNLEFKEWIATLSIWTWTPSLCRWSG